MSKLAVFIQGPTASGKTALGIHLAEAFGGEIISCDSIQCYKDFDIGSAKPDASELAKVPHHLISHLHPTVKYTAGEFRRDALAVIEKRKNEIDTFYVVGGTGFYFMALEKGMHETKATPEPIRQAVLKDLDEKGLDYLYAELSEKDKDYAAKVSKNDSYRILRAIEILRAFGDIPSELRKSFQADAFPFPILKLGLKIDREVLRKRITARVDSMMRLGWIEEVQCLHQKYGKDLPAMESVGYKEICQYLDGKLKKEELLEWIVIKNMQLAKKQVTWFKRDPDTHWLGLDDGQKAKDLMQAFKELHENR